MLLPPMCRWHSLCRWHSMALKGSVLGFGQGYAPRHIRVTALYLAALSLTSSSSKWVGLPAPAAERQSTGKTMLRSVASESSVAAGSKGAPRPPQWMGGSGSQSATEPVASSAPSLVATRRAPSLRTLHKVVEQHLPRSRPPAGASPSAVRTARCAARGLAGTACLNEFTAPSQPVGIGPHGTRGAQAHLKCCW